MAVTVVRIKEVIPNDYMGNDRTIFEDERGQEIYTFGKVQEGQSYEGIVKTDRKGNLQFKKDTAFNSPAPPQFQGGNGAPAAPTAAPANPTEFIQAVAKFDQAVDKFLSGVDQLTTIQHQSKPVTDEEVKRTEEFFAS